MEAATQAEGMDNHVWSQVKETPTTGYFIGDTLFIKVSIEFCDLIADTFNGSGGIRVYYEYDAEQLYITHNDLDFAIINMTSFE